MTDREKRFAEIYKKIKKITGLKFDEKDAAQVQKALSRIYINGKNLWSGKGYENLKDVMDQKVEEIGGMLMKAQDVNNRDFISIMNPDDPYAVPRMIPYNTPVDWRGKKVALTEEIEEKFDEKVANGEAYESSFKSHHRERLGELGEKLRNHPLEGAYLKAENFFGKDVPAGAANAVSMCNLVLLNRGYTWKELGGESEELQEARKQVGQELREAMYGNIPKEEREKKLQELTGEALEALNRQQFKQVDYSDESTFENARFNQMLASSVTNMYQLVKELKTEADWKKTAVTELEQLKNFTDGVTRIDFLRLEGISGNADMANAMTGQTLIEKAEADYAKYRTSTFGAVKNNPPVDFSIGNGVDSAVENIKAATSGKKPEEKLSIPWFEEIDGKNPVECGKELQEIFAGAPMSQQVGRISTMTTLFLAYGLMDAEQHFRPLGIMDFLNNKELQRETGRKAMEFFRAHPFHKVPTGRTKLNVMAYGEMMAVLNKKIMELELPEVDLQQPEKVRERAKTAAILGGILTDSHQLNDMVPDSLKPVYMEELGGEEKYQEYKDKINIAKSFLHAEKSLPFALDAGKKRYRAVLEASEMVPAFGGINLLQTQGKNFLGKKIGDFAADTDTAKKIVFMTETAAPDIQDYINKLSETKEGKKKVVDYLTSAGSNGKEEIGDALQKVVEETQTRHKKLEEMVERQEKLQREAEKSAAPYDWSAEFTPEQWRKRLTGFYREILRHDPKLLHSSDEYREIRKGLKNALEALNDRKKFNEEMDKVFSNGGKYLHDKDKKLKKGESIGKLYGQERYDAVSHMQYMLTHRHTSKLEPEGIADICGTGATTQEKLETGMARLGMYLKQAKTEADPKKRGEMLSLAERVLEERGKNNASRNELRKRLEEMDSIIEKQTDRKQMYREARQEIADRLAVRKPEEGKSMPRQGLPSLKIAWCKVMDAFETMAQQSKLPEMKGLRHNSKVHQIALMGRIGEKALETKTKIYDIERPGRLTKEETGIVVADAVLDSLMRMDIGEEAKPVLESFMKGKKTVEEVCKGVENTYAYRTISDIRANDSLQTRVASPEGRKELGISGSVSLRDQILGKRRLVEKKDVIDINPIPGFSGKKTTGKVTGHKSTNPKTMSSKGKGKGLA